MSRGGNEITLKPLGPSDLQAFKTFLGGTEFGGCFCAVWSSYDDTWTKRCGDPLQPNYEISEKLVMAGKHLGYLVYRGADLVGWTGSGPKTDFSFLAKKLASRLTPSEVRTWSIGCLAVGNKFRGQGLAEVIVRDVIQKATFAGATAIEAYPVRPFDEARVFRGSYSMYARLGFVECGAEKDDDFEILLMRKKLGD